MATQTGSYDFKAAKDAYDKGKAAEDEAKETHAYFWHTITNPGNNIGKGAHITQIEQDEFVNDPENGGGNTLITTDSVKIRDGVTELASFGATGARIGHSGTSVLELKTDGITGYGEEGNKCFCIESNGGTESTTIYAEIPTESTLIQPPTGDSSTIDSCPIMDVIKSLPSLSTGTVVNISSLFGQIKIPSNLDFTTVSWDEQNSWRRDTDFFNKRTVTCMPPEGATITIGTAATFSCTNSIQMRRSGSTSYMRVKFKVSYNPSTDGNNIRLGIYANQNGTMFYGYFYFGGEIHYVSTAKTPATTFGERNGQGGSYSAVIGKALYANGNNQTAIGKYNVADNSNKYALIIGNGTSDNERSNAVTVDWDGIVSCRNHNNEFNTIFNLIYPVGSIYMSVNSTSPQTLFGGTWARITGRFLLAATDNGSSGASQAPGNTGGAATVTLTAAQSGLPSHSHSTNSSGTQFVTIKSGTSIGSNRPGSSGTTTNYFVNTSASSNPWGRDTYTSSESKNATSAHENMPPYLAVYVWKRTA